MSDKKSKEVQLSFLENFSISGVSAVISKTISAPIELIKLNIQNQNAMLKSKRLDRPYTGIFDCAKRIMKQQGLLAFWRGNLANCLRYFPTQALNFAFKDNIKKMFILKKDDSYVAKFSKNIASGGLAGSLSLLFVYHLDFARTRLANDTFSALKSSSRQYSGLIDVYRKTFQTDSIQGLYRGFNISCAGIFVYRGCYFGFYDSLKPILLQTNNNFFLSFILGYFVTISAGIISYPIDTVRRRMMMTTGESVKYKNSMDCFNSIIKKEGAKSLMKGACANIARGATGAFVLVLFDKGKEFYIDLKYNRS